MSSVRGVALCPCGQVAPLGVLLLALRVAPTTVVWRPAGVGLLRVAQPSSAGVHQAPVTDRVTASVAPNAAVHAEMVETRARPRSSPRGVHNWGRGGGGRWWMDVVKERWTSRNGQEPPSSHRFSASLCPTQLPLTTTGYCECFLGHLKVSGFK